MLKRLKCFKAFWDSYSCASLQMQRKEEQLAVSDPQNTIFAMSASKNVTNIYSSSFERSYCSNFVSFSLKMSVISNNTKPYNCKKNMI